jgi:hypothetical protein
MTMEIGGILFTSIVLCMQTAAPRVVEGAVETPRGLASRRSFISGARHNRSMTAAKPLAAGSPVPKILLCQKNPGISGCGAGERTPNSRIIHPVGDEYCVLE